MDLQIGNHLSCHAVCCVSEDKEFESFILLLPKFGFTGYIWASFQYTFLQLLHLASLVLFESNGN